MINWLRYHLLPYFEWLLSKQLYRSHIFTATSGEKIDLRLTYQNFDYSIEFVPIFIDIIDIRLGIWYKIQSLLIIDLCLEPVIIHIRPAYSWEKIFKQLHKSFKKHPAIIEGNVPVYWFTMQVMKQLKVYFKKSVS